LKSVAGPSVACLSGAGRSHPAARQFGIRIGAGGIKDKAAAIANWLLWWCARSRRYLQDDLNDLVVRGFNDRCCSPRDHDCFADGRSGATKPGAMAPSVRSELSSPVPQGRWRACWVRLRTAMLKIEESDASGGEA